MLDGLPAEVEKKCPADAVFEPEYAASERAEAEALLGVLATLQEQSSTLERSAFLCPAAILYSRFPLTHLPLSLLSPLSAVPLPQVRGQHGGLWPRLRPLALERPGEGQQQQQQ